MDPYQALESAENALRLAIVAVKGDTWMTLVGAPSRTWLEKRRANEALKRPSVIVSESLLQYADTSHLTNMINQNYAEFAGIFPDEVLMRGLLAYIGNLRNTVAHNRALMGHENLLLEGTSGEIRNLVSLYRNKLNPSAAYYPLIETVVDNFGNEGRAESAFGQTMQRVEIGQTLTFVATAWDSRSRNLFWYVRVNQVLAFLTTPFTEESPQGGRVTLSWTPTEEDIGESVWVSIIMRSEARYHREKVVTGVTFDDIRYFQYSVNPPC